MSKGAHRKDDPIKTAKDIQAGKIHRYNKNKRWTYAEEQTLLRLRREGKTWSQVASALHRTKIGVTQRLKVMKLREAAQKAMREKEMSDANG